MCPLLQIECNYFPFLAITREDAGVGARAGNALCDWGPGGSLRRRDWRAPGRAHSGEPCSSDQSVHCDSSLSDFLLSSSLLPHWDLISSLLKHCSSHLVCSFTPIHTKSILKSGSPHPFLFFFLIYKLNYTTQLLLEYSHRKSKYFIFWPYFLFTPPLPS